MKGWGLKWNRFRRSQSFALGKDLLEDLEEFWFLYFPIVGGVNSLDELLDFSLGDLPAGVHGLEGSVDELHGLVLIQVVVLVGVELVEHGVHSLPNLFVVV